MITITLKEEVAKQIAKESDTFLQVIMEGFKTLVPQETFENKLEKIALEAAGEAKNRISAIKAVRQETDWSLKTAKDFVDKLIPYGS